MLKEFTENFEGVFSEITVDFESRIIKGAALCGLVSKNRRRYTPECLASAVSLYENSKIFIDHPNETDTRRGWRSTRDLGGAVENVRFNHGKLRGDVRCLNTEGGRMIFEIAQNAPNAAGFSHNVQAEYHREGSEEIITRIESVASVDLVTQPATVSGIYESIKKGNSNMEAERIAEGLKTPESSGGFLAIIEDECINRIDRKDAENKSAEAIASGLKGQNNYGY